MKVVQRFVFAVLAATALCSHAQVTAVAPVTEDAAYSERWDLYGGAQYSHFNPGQVRGIHAINLLGWTGAGTLWFRPSLGLDASVRGLYGTIVPPVNAYGITNYPMSEHLFLFGPNYRFLRRPKYDVGAHALIGAAYGKFDNNYPARVQPVNLGIYNTKLAFGFAIGAYADYNLTPRWSVRLVPDWQQTKFGFIHQNEFAGSVGIVYKFGSLRK